MKKKYAFTLIELLIVVAIIAILAAIAVPNFMEAQVRAKVSRAMNDLRTCTVAIESYAVDNLRHPIGLNEGANMNPALWDKLDTNPVWGRLTTPVSYITTVLNDPFTPFGRGDAGSRNPLQTSYFYNHNTHGGNLYRHGFLWQNYSCGPDGKAEGPWLGTMVNSNEPNNVYDSTNGTKSVGIIYWTNKGRYLGN